MSDVIIRGCRPGDEDGIVEVCYRTGYMGEDLTGRNLFNDRELFGDLYCRYFPRYEAEHCFVAVDESGQVLGYIIGTDNTIRQTILFAALMLGRIIFRLLTYTLWVHPESFRAVMHTVFSARVFDEPPAINSQYPAHFHINVRPGYQHLGIGSRLLERFEAAMGQRRVRGIHLRTSNQNAKALPFYQKKGYRIILEQDSSTWAGVKGFKSLVFGKKLAQD